MRVRLSLLKTLMGDRARGRLVITIAIETCRYDAPELDLRIRRSLEGLLEVVCGHDDFGLLVFLLLASLGLVIPGSVVRTTHTNNTFKTSGTESDNSIQVASNTPTAIICHSQLQAERERVFF